MAEPSFLGEGVTPLPTDTAWRQLVKLVAEAYNNAPDPDPANKPDVHDTRWRLTQKLNKILAG